MRLRDLLLCVVLVAGVALRVDAAPILFTDRAAFEATVGDGAVTPAKGGTCGVDPFYTTRADSSDSGCPRPLKHVLSATRFYCR
jgi:hypothetical protein